MANTDLRGPYHRKNESFLADKATRNDEDSNILAVPSQLFADDKQKVFVIVETWINTPFAKAARYIRRNQELDNLN